ncbi:MAG: hypothetical protein AAF730_04700 [Bacteroidota bacterium]
MLKRSELRPAQTLLEIYNNISNEPLMQPAELKAFYRPAVNAVRGLDQTARMHFKLLQSYEGLRARSFLVGHSGVGKSTEMTRLIFSPEIQDKFEVIRFSAARVFNPVGLHPFDVILYMMGALIQRTTELLGPETGGQPEKLYEDILAWMGRDETEALVKRSYIDGSQAKIGVDTGPLGMLLSVFGVLKREQQFSYDETTRTIDYNVRRISDLLNLCNRLLDACSGMLRLKNKKEWLILGEDFDKREISTDSILALFIENGLIFDQLRVHYVFSLPVALCYSTLAAELPLRGDAIYNIHDTPVFHQDHTPHEAGRNAVRAILEARVNLDLLDDDALERLIVASGGNLRNLFSLLVNASEAPLLNGTERITLPDVTRAVNGLRNDYRNRLGTGPYEKTKIAYEDKAKRLLSIYHGDEAAAVPDDILFALLRARAVQEFNGERWFGVHPLVVEVLRAQGLLDDDG